MVILLLVIGILVGGLLYSIAKANQYKYKLENLGIRDLSHKSNKTAQTSNAYEYRDIGSIQQRLEHDLIMTFFYASNKLIPIDLIRSYTEKELLEHIKDLETAICKVDVSMSLAKCYNISSSTLDNLKDIRNDCILLKDTIEREYLTPKINLKY